VAARSRSMLGGPRRPPCAKGVQRSLRLAEALDVRTRPRTTSCTRSRPARIRAVRSARPRGAWSITPAGPCGCVGSFEKCVDLGSGQEVDERASRTSCPARPGTRWMTALCSGTWRAAYWKKSGSPASLAFRVRGELPRSSLRCGPETRRIAACRGSFSASAEGAFFRCCCVKAAAGRRCRDSSVPLRTCRRWLRRWSTKNASAAQGIQGGLHGDVLSRSRSDMARLINSDTAVEVPVGVADVSVPEVGRQLRHDARSTSTSARYQRSMVSTGHR